MEPKLLFPRVRDHHNPISDDASGGVLLLKDSVEPRNHFFIEKCIAILNEKFDEGVKLGQVTGKKVILENIVSIAPFLVLFEIRERIDVELEVRKPQAPGNGVDALALRRESAACDESFPMAPHRK